MGKDLKGTWLNPEEQRSIIHIIENTSWPVARTCEVLGLNPCRYYRWKNRLNAGDPVGQDVFRPHRLLPEEKEAVIQHALDTEHRHRNLAYDLRRKNLAYVSASSVYRILKEAGLIAEYNPPKKPMHKKEIKTTGPYQVWRTDITYIKLEQGFAYLISVLDSYSRFIVHAELLSSMTTADMKKVVDTALYKEGLLDKKNKPVLISDNGTQLVSKSFKQFLRDLGVKHIRTAHRHPESNGMMEVFHKTLKYERVYLKELYPNILTARDDIMDFIRTYNHYRLHQGIGFVTPYERHSGKDEKIKKKYEYKLQQARQHRLQINRNSCMHAAA